MDYALLTDQELIGLLSTEGDRLPRSAVDEIVRRGERLAPAIVRILDDQAAWSAQDPSWWAVVHAAFILGAAKPPGALQILLRAVEQAHRFEVDWIYDVSSSMYESFGPDAAPALRSFALDSTRKVWPRINALHGLALIARSHPELVEDVASILRALASKTEEGEDVRQFAASFLIDFARPEDREILLRHAGEIYTHEEVEEVLRGEKPHFVPDARDWLSFYDADEIEERQKRWRRDKLDRERSEGQRIEQATAVERQEEGLETDDAMRTLVNSEGEEGPSQILREGPKIGRNDPCPCGSGKKYKKCCGK